MVFRSVLWDCGMLPGTYRPVILSLANTGRAAYLLTGALLYLVGAILVTIACNVPLNDALATVDPSSASAGRVWTNYLKSWTSWNHVRTIAALAAAVSFTMALCHSK
jgi:uncharacterized membrane protein